MEEAIDWVEGLTALLTMDSVKELGELRAMDSVKGLVAQLKVLQ